MATLVLVVGLQLRGFGLYTGFPYLTTSTYRPTIRTCQGSNGDQEELFLQEARPPGLTTND